MKYPPKFFIKNLETGDSYIARCSDGVIYTNIAHPLLRDSLFTAFQELHLFESQVGRFYISEARVIGEYQNMATFQFIFTETPNV